MHEFRFDKTYLDYYQDRLERASDGTRVPGLTVTASLVDRLHISSGDRVLDVGCSFGRLLPILTPLTNEIYGLEMSYDVVDVAARADYRFVVRGSAEDSNMSSYFFDHLVLFGVFDCCDQAAALRETHRLLKPGGLALITGKNVDYHDDDRLALLAERNAWRKRFPNSFTYAADLWERLPAVGLELVELMRFERRGDFGEMRLLRDDRQTGARFYEYAAVVRSTSTPTQLPAVNFQVSDKMSQTAGRSAEASGFATVEQYFDSDCLEQAAL